MNKHNVGDTLTLVATNVITNKALIGKKAKVEQVVTFGLTEAMYWVKVGRTRMQVCEHWLA